MATPCFANSSIIEYISVFAPISIPLVGSSRISILGFVASHLAIMAFCWLPPLRFPIYCWGDDALTLNASMYCPIIPFSRFVFTLISLINASNTARDMLYPTPIWGMIPCSLRFSGTMAIPILIAWAGFLISSLFPSNMISPLSGCSKPNNADAISVLPAPIRPVTPSTSPFFISKLTSSIYPSL